MWGDWRLLILVMWQVWENVDKIRRFFFSLSIYFESVRLLHASQTRIWIFLILWQYKRIYVDLNGARRWFLQLVHAKWQTNKSTNLLHEITFYRFTEDRKQTYRLQFTRSPHKKSKISFSHLSSPFSFFYAPDAPLMQFDYVYGRSLILHDCIPIICPAKPGDNNSNNNKARKNDNKNHVYGWCWISVWTTKIINYQIPIRRFGCESEPVHLLLFYTWYGKYPIINAFVPTSSLAYIDPNAHNSGSRVPYPLHTV